VTRDSGAKPRQFFLALDAVHARQCVAAGIAALLALVLLVALVVGDHG